MPSPVARTVVFLALILLPGCDLPAEAVAPPPPAVVFVCEHGAGKSLIAAKVFDRAAARRGLPHRALARGLDPYAAVPPVIAAALAADGFDVAGFVPTRLAHGEAGQAPRVVAIGVSLAAYEDDLPVPAIVWDDVPPASLDYTASRDALERRIEILLDEMTPAASVPRRLE
jgi:hypothetical protein